MRKILVFCSIILEIFVCNAQRSNQQIPILVTEINLNDANVIRYKYDGNKLVQTEDRNSKSIYTYNGNFIVQIKDYKDEELVRTTDFTYNKSGNLETIDVSGRDEYVGPNIPYKDNYTFVYPTSTTVVSTKIRIYTLSEEEKDGNEEINLLLKQEKEQDIQKDVTTYTLKNGNIIYQNELFYYENVLDSDQAQKTIYDQRNNPFVNILGYDKIRIYLIEAYDELMSGKNNIISYENFREHIPIKEYGSSKKFAIIYNNYGFPVKITSNLFNRDGILAEKDVLIYSYNNQ